MWSLNSFLSMGFGKGPMIGIGFRRWLVKVWLSYTFILSSSPYKTYLAVSLSTSGEKWVKLWFTSIFSYLDAIRCLEYSYWLSVLAWIRGILVVEDSLLIELLKDVMNCSSCTKIRIVVKAVPLFVYCWNISVAWTLYFCSIALILQRCTT